MKKAGKILIFLSIIVLLTCFLQKVFVPKWEEDGLWEPVTTMIDGFFAEEEDTIDVIYLGSSNTFYDVNPLMIYEEYGLTGYVLGSGEQSISCSYYYLQEALKRQKPKVVVLDCLSVFVTKKTAEEQNRKAYDYMPLSKEKIASLKVNIREEESLVSYIFPMIRYHGRVWDLTSRDFSYLFSDKKYYLKGYAYSEKQAEDLPELNMDIVLHKNIKINKKNRRYLYEIKRICQENDIQLVFIKTPNIEWGKYEHNKMARLAEKMEVPFWDYNLFYKEIGINVEEHFLDGAHLNYKGAEKMSKHLGESILSFIEEMPEHSQEVQDAWEEDLRKYKDMTRNNKTSQ